jgi:GNAT superfamily N-acetyltransferase
MKIINRSTLTSNQKGDIFTLWNNEYPRQLAHNSTDDLEKYLDKLKNKKHYLLINESDQILGWGLVFIREGETWFAMIIAEQIQKQGFGTKLLARMKKNHDRLCGWIIDHEEYIKVCGEKYLPPANFYLRNGFQIIPKERYDSEQLSVVKIKWENKKDL